MSSKQLINRFAKNKILNNAILSPLSEEHDWQNIEIVTLKQSTIDKATDYVLSNVQIVTDVNAQVHNELQNAEYRIGREFVDVDGESITIGMSCDEINDTIVDKAISRLMEMDNIEQGITYYGPELVMDFDCHKKVDVV